MATSINTLKNWFKTGMFPTQAQFWAWLDSFYHKDENIPVAKIEGLSELLTPVNEHFNDPNAHTELFDKVSEINTIIVDSGFTKEDNLFTGIEDSIWNLKGQEFTNPENIEITIPLCATGMLRMDRVVLDMNNQIVLVQGDEYESNPLPPSKPVNTLDYTFIPVNDTEVGTPEPILLGDTYQEKKFDLSQTFTASGSDVVIELNKLSRRVIFLNGSMTSIAGLEMDAPLVNEYPHEGKIFVFINQTDHDITLRHFDTDNTIFFIFKKGLDLVLPTGERIEFMFRSGIMDEHLRSWESELIGEIQLPAYTSARNDGANPNNKVLNVDASGNLKLYSMPLMPPPYLEELIPDSYLPSNTGNFIVRGSFFTPSTTITVEGQTLNYLTFVSDNEIHVNLTTGSTEGTFDVTINNGISVTFSDALLVVLGEVFTPTDSDYTVLSGNVDTSVDGEIKVEVENVAGVVEFYDIPHGQDFRVNFRIAKSPINSLEGTGLNSTKIQLCQSGTVLFSCLSYINYISTDNFYFYVQESSTGIGYGNPATNITDLIGKLFTYERIGTTFRFKVDNVTVKTFTDTVASGDLQIRIGTQFLDIVNIKYIELI